MNSLPRILLAGMLLLLALAGCESGRDRETRSQQFYFLQSLQQVEDGGRQLQASGLNQAELTQALELLDRGLGLAFQVERKFLDALDLRLGKNFDRYFIKGVENYRLGIEAGDRDQQIEGLRLLRQWAEFWNAEKQSIQARLHPE